MVMSIKSNNYNKDKILHHRKFNNWKIIKDKHNKL
jgi:hypothetical protein